MKILTLIRQVPDAEETIRLRDGAVDLSASKLVMDAMDEYGVEEALRLREAGTDAEIVVIAVGPSRTEEALRTALAMGADRAVFVESPSPLDPVTLSSVVSAIAKEESAELILCGGQQADWDSQALGAAVAERMGWPQVTWTTALQMDAGLLRGRHDADEGAETFEVTLPAVVTTQQGLNDPRYPTLPNIMKSKKKEICRRSLSEFNVVPKVRLLGAEIQVKQRQGQMADGKDAPSAAAELVRFLREEAKVVA